MNRQEVFEAVVDAITQRMTASEFEPGEFRVVSNDAMRTISVIEVATSQSLGLLDISFSYFTGGRNENDPICIHLPAAQTADVCSRCGQPVNQHPWLADYASMGCLSFTA